MTAEELFEAIGQVESTRLLRSELTVQPTSGKGRTPKRTTRRVLRNILIAAILTSLLAVTAYAVGGFLIFDSPQEMLTAIFGDETGFDHKEITYWSDPEKPDSQYTNPAFDRVEAEQSVVEEDVAPHVSAVGKSISWRGYTLTVDALMYDSITKCGILTCKVENSEGIKPYNVGPTGEVWNHPVDFNQYGYTHIIQEKTTDTCLALTYYFQYDSEYNREMEATISQWTFVEPGAEYQTHIMELFEEIKQEYTLEEAIAAYIEEHGQEEYDTISEESTEEQMRDYCYAVLWNRRLEEMYLCPETIIISPDRESSLKNISLGDGTISISPISFRIDVENLEYLHTINEFTGERMIDAGYIQSVVINYEDGTQYTVMDEGVSNTIFQVTEYPKDDNMEQEKTDSGYVTHHSKNCSILTIMFNRIIDVEKVSSVTINGCELPTD